MDHMRFVDAFLLFFTSVIILLLIIRVCVLIYFRVKYNYEFSFVMLFYWFPYQDIKNTVHSKVRFLKKIYNRTTVPFLLIFILIVGLKIFLHLIGT